MKKSIAFLLASLAATSSLLFHTQVAKAGINDNNECNIKILAKLIFVKAPAGGAYAIVPDIPPKFNKKNALVGKNEKRAKKYFKQMCKEFKN